MNRKYTLIKNIAGTILTKRVGYVIFYVTAYCNLLCKHCFYTQQIRTARERKELTTQEYKQISDRLGPLTNINFTGGEPFLRKDLGEIIRHMSMVNTPSFFGITTNGLLTARILQTMAEILPYCNSSYIKLGISLDGIREQHNYIRGVESSYDKAIATIMALDPLRKKYKNFFVYVSTTLTSSNYKTMNELIDQVHKLPVDAHYLGYIRGDIEDDKEHGVSTIDYRKISGYLEEKWKSRKDIFAFLNLLNKTTRKVNAKVIDDNEYMFPCVAGKQMLTFTEDGKVIPCEILPKGEDNSFVMGDIRDYNYDTYKLLESKKAILISEWIKETKCHCTFECATQASLAYQPVSFLKVLTKL